MKNFHMKLRLIVSTFALLGMLMAGLLYMSLFSGELKSPHTPNCYRCNIVLIVIDPLRHDELPCYGYKRNTSENICRLADQSMLFENVFSQSSWTLPSIMSLFSSQYPNQHKIFIPNQDVLAPDIVTLPQALKKAGYHTVYVGSTNDSHIPIDKGIGRGFDSIVPYESMDTATTMVGEIKATTPFFLFVHSFDLRVSATKVNRDQQFIFDPTFTFRYQTPAPNVDPTRDTPQNIRFLRNMYDQRLYELDKQIGSLLSELEKNDLSQNTIVVITSNHGDEFGEHGNTSHGINLYDSVTHVPLIMALPHQTTPRRIRKLIQSIDIYPTLLDIIDVAKPVSVIGKNLFDTKHEEPINHLVVSQLEPQKAIIGLRTPEWSYFFRSNETSGSGDELYNRLNDPQERINTAASYPHVIQALRVEYERMISREYTQPESRLTP